MKVRLVAKTQPFDVLYSGKHAEGKNRKLTCEEYVAWCARISSRYNRLNHETAPKLLKYLMDNKHWSPNEMVSFAFEIQTSRAIAQQLLRHRSFSFQEFSQRYAKVDAIEFPEMRGQAEKNRQSSTEVRSDWDVAVHAHMQKTQDLYSAMLDDGIAKECARMVLPLATQTTLIMHGTFRSWIHFLDTRCDDHAQKEIRQIANEIRKGLVPEMPYTAAALGWIDKPTTTGDSQ